MLSKAVLPAYEPITPSLPDPGTFVAANGNGSSTFDHPQTRTTTNRLLSALPASDYERLQPLLHPVSFSGREILYRPGDTIRRVYFPDGSTCSITSVMNDGRMLEIATIGNEGMIGITAFLGGDRQPCGAVMQVPGGDVQSMSLEAFKEEIGRRGPLYDVVSRYSQAFLALLMQLSACNGLHKVEERCCRWLLTMHDRVGTDEFHVTQEFLALMVGVHRPTVTFIARDLQKAGLIDYHRGKIRIINRKGLEAASCECYVIVKAHFDRLLP